MSVTRYEVNGASSVFEDANGSLVDYEDYAALEARCAALAAENVGLKEYLAPVGLEVEGTPAIDAFLAEVRAQGVDALVERRLTAARLAKEAGYEITARDLEGEAIRARFFARELRKGGA